MGVGGSAVSPALSVELCPYLPRPPPARACQHSFLAPLAPPRSPLPVADLSKKAAGLLKDWFPHWAEAGGEGYLGSDDEGGGYGDEDGTADGGYGAAASAAGGQGFYAGPGGEGYPDAAPRAGSHLHHPVPAGAAAVDGSGQFRFGGFAGGAGQPAAAAPGAWGGVGAAGQSAFAAPPGAAGAAPPGAPGAAPFSFSFSGAQFQ